MNTSSALLDLLASAARGPQREGLFTLWLLARAADDECLDPPLSPKARAVRFDAVSQRLAGSSAAPPLRRALAGALAHLRQAGPRSAALALQQLVAPVRETLGAEAAAILTKGTKRVSGER